MLASYALRRPDESVRTFRRCQEALAEALDIDPFTDTLRLLNAIQHGVPVTELLPSSGGGGAEGSETDVPDRRDQARRMPFVGREELLERLRSHAAASRNGLRFVIVEGSHGMGRTTLLDQLADSLSGPIGRTTCTPLHAGVSLSTLTLALRDADKRARRRGASVVIDHEAARQLASDRSGKALDSLYDLVRSRAPVTLLLDDLHHADAESILVLDHLTVRDPALPIAVIATSLPATAGDAAPVRHLRPTERLFLEPLTEADVAGLDGLHPALPSYFGGQLSLLADWWRWRAAGREGLPASLRSGVIRWIRLLGGLASPILQVAAVLDEPFDHLAIIRSTDLPGRDVVDELDRLRDLDVLLVDADGLAFRFRHPVVRDILAETVTPGRRQLARRRQDGHVGGQGPVPAGA
jgi:hypothetical protein